MPGCAAIGCNNRSEKGYTMKCFPRDPALRKIWKQRVGRADWEPSNNSFLCHVHFEPNQWVVTPSGKIKLKKGALPSIFTVTSTRKSPKKRQKLGVPPVEVEEEEDDEEEDLEEYEVEYLENDCPFIFNTSNQKIVPNIINVQTQVCKVCILPKHEMKIFPILRKITTKIFFSMLQWVDKFCKMSNS